MSSRKSLLFPFPVVGSGTLLCMMVTTLLLLPCRSSATLLGFEDVGSYPYDSVTSYTSGYTNLRHYGGINWGAYADYGVWNNMYNFWLLDNTSSIFMYDKVLPDGTTVPFSDSGYVHGAVSGSHVAYNGGGDYAWITTYTLERWNTILSPAPEFLSGAPTFTWNGATFSAAWVDGLQLEILGYGASWNPVASSWVLDYTPSYSTTLTLSRTEPLRFDAGWSGVARLVFNSYYDSGTAVWTGDSTQFAMDDFRYNEAPAGTGVPEPGTVGLFAVGLVLLGTLRRPARRMKATS